MKFFFSIICLMLSMSSQATKRGVEVIMLNNTLFLTAAGKGNYSISSLCRCGAQVNCVDAAGETPLHYAARALQVGNIKKLLAAGADPAKTDCWGRTARQKLPRSLLRPEHPRANTLLKDAEESQQKEKDFQKNLKANPLYPVWKEVLGWED